MVTKAQMPGHIIDCALELAATQGWRETTLADIAVAAKISLAVLHGHYPSKQAILAAYLDRVDRAMITGVGPELLAEPVRDRLFEVIMRRFDALAPQREGVRAIVRASCGDPCLGLATACRLRRSLALVLEVSGLDSSGVRGVIRIKALGLLYLRVLRVWLDDDSEDMARTMAALDKGLDRLDRAAARFSRRRSRDAAPEPA